MRTKRKIIPHASLRRHLNQAGESCLQPCVNGYLFKALPMEWRSTDQSKGRIAKTRIRLKPILNHIKTCSLMCQIYYWSHHENCTKSGFYSLSMGHCNKISCLTNQFELESDDIEFDMM